MAGNSGRRITINFIGNAASLEQAADDGAAALDGLSGKLGGFGKKLAGGLAAAGLAAGAALGAGVLSGMNNEKESDRAAAALGLSPAEAAENGRIAGSLYSQAYGESMGDVTRAIENVKGSFRDLGGEELETVTRQAMDFAAIFEADLPAATAAAQTAVKNGLAGSATEAFDLMTAAMQKVPPALRENVVDAVSEYAPYLADLGFEGEQAFSLIAAASADGAIGMDKVGDSLKEFTIRATDMSTGSVAAYDAMGLSAEDMAGKLLAGGDQASGALGDIVDGLLAIKDPTEQANTAIALFGTPLEDMSVAQIPDFLNALDEGANGLGNFEGAIDRAGAVANDNATTNLTSFGRTIKTTFVDLLGGVVLPKLNEWSTVLVQKAGPAMDTLRDVVEDAKPKIVAFGQEVARIWEKVQPALGRARDWIASTFADVRVIVSSAVTIVEQLWSRFGDQIITFTIATFENLRTVIGGALTVIRGIFSTFSALLRGDWSGVWNGIKTIVSGAWQMITGIVRQGASIIAFAFRNLGTIISSVWSGLWRGVGTLVSRGINSIVGAIRGVPGKITALGASFKQAGSAVMGKLLDGFANAGEFVADIAGNVWGVVKRSLNSAIRAINNKLDFNINLPMGLGSFRINAPDIPQFARGVLHAPRGTAWVGERGPELMNLRPGTQIIPARDSARMAAGAGVALGSTVINVRVDGALDPMAVARQIEALLVKYVRLTGKPLQVRTV